MELDNNGKKIKWQHYAGAEKLADSAVPVAYATLAMTNADVLVVPTFARNIVYRSQRP
jgi:hypothetical protein